MNFDEADLAFACDLLAFVDIDKSIDNTGTTLNTFTFITQLLTKIGVKVNSLKKVRITAY